MTDPVERPEAETTAEEREGWLDELSLHLAAPATTMPLEFAMAVLRDLARAEAEIARLRSLLTPREGAETTVEERRRLALDADHMARLGHEYAGWPAEMFQRLHRDLARAEAIANEATAERDAANARAERLAGALPDLDPVITWLADGCHVPSAVAALRLLKGRIDAALLTEPEAKGGDPAPVSGRCQITGKYPWLVSHNVCSCDPCRTWRDTSFHVSPSAPVPATTEKTDAREALRLAALDAEVCVHECPHCGYSEPIKDWDISHHVLAAARAAGITTTLTEGM